MLTKPQEIIQAMSTGVDDMYFLNCGLERRVNVLSQQFRGISLVSCLFEEGEERKLRRKIGGVPASKVAIIGAGVAGISAACRAVYGGCEVSVFERNTQPFGPLRGSQRYLWPRLYEWPRENFESTHAELSILDWQAGTAEEVIDCLERQWEWWKTLYNPNNERSTGHLRMLSSAKIVECESLTNGFQLTWEHEGKTDTDKYDCVILAMGFGKEFARDFPPGQEVSYWKRPVAKITPRSEPWKILVSGIGDSALRDIINDLACDNILESPPTSEAWSKIVKALKNVREQAEQIAGIEKGFLGDPEVACEKLESLFDALARDFSNELPLALACGSGKVTMALQGRQPHYLAPRSFPLNRLLLHALQYTNKGQLSLEYIEIKNTDRHNTDRPSSIGECAKTEKGLVKVLWPTQLRGNTYCRVYFRHGTERDTNFQGIFEGILAKMRGDRREEPIEFLTGDYLYRKTSAGGTFNKLRFYSDLHDSIIQRDLEAAFEYTKVDNGGDLSDLYIPLYAGRLRLDLLVYDEVIFTDSDFLDGRFFIRRWLDGVHDEWGMGLDEFNQLIRDHRICLKFRNAGGIWQTLQQMLLREGNGSRKSRGYLFSGLGSFGIESSYGDLAKGEEIKIGEDLNEMESMEEFVRCLKEKVKQDNGLNGHAQVLEKRINALFDFWTLCAGQSWIQKIWDPPESDLAGSFEDPARFILALETKAGRDAATFVFGHSKRSEVDLNIRERKGNGPQEDRKDYARIHEWYNRAYNRAIAKQHGANVIETTFVNSLPQYMENTPGRDGDSQNPGLFPIEPQDLLGLARLSQKEFERWLIDAPRSPDPSARLSWVLEKIGEEELRKTLPAETYEMVGQLQNLGQTPMEPAFRLLTTRNSSRLRDLDEYRIFDSISPARVAVSETNDGLPISLVEYFGQFGAEEKTNPI